MSTFQNLHKQALVLAVAGALGIAGIAQAATVQTTALTRATQLARGDVMQGSLALSHPVHVTIALKLRNAGQLQAFNARPHAPLSQTQLAANHLPTQAQAQTVADFLTRAGFRNVKIGVNRMLVSADGSAAVAQSAFGTNMVNVRTHDGRNAFANASAIRIPASLQGTVQAVLGLQTVHQMHTLAHQVQPAARAGGVSITGHNPATFDTLYQADSLAPATDVQVGIITAGDVHQTITDLNTFTTQNSLPPVTVNVICVDSTVDGSTDPTCGSTDSSGLVEWNLDSQDITGIGGVTNLTLYDSPSLQNDQLTDTISRIVTDNFARVINVSLGECERYTDINQGGDGSGQADDALFMTAVSQGQTFSVSTGDSGSDECGDGQKNSASSPASSPYVVAVGGTTLTTGRQGQYFTETVWSGGGGSPSSFELAPQWQLDSGVLGQGATARGLPDIAFVGDPQSGAIIVINGGPGQIGGTSLSAPLFAGAWARILQGNPGLGFAAPHLYTDLSSSDYRDVVRGSNGQYSAKVGWDYTTGFGSLKVSQAAADLATPQ